MTAVLAAVRFAANLSAVLVRAVADGLESFADSLSYQQETAPDVVPDWMWSE